VQMPYLHVCAMNSLLRVAVCCSVLQCVACVGERVCMSLTCK